MPPSRTLTSRKKQRFHIKYAYRPARAAAICERQVWSIQQGVRLHCFTHKGIVTDISIHRDMIISCSEDNTVAVWKFAAIQPVRGAVLVLTSV